LYIENPKTKGSGILCAIPQSGRCPVGCAECFFQSGRSFLEPLDENLPNMPDIHQTKGRIVRVNDGNDSNVDREAVIRATDRFPMRFFNTSIPKDLSGFPDPVVLTLNPSSMTDESFHRIETPPENLMFVRFRTNSWNLPLLQDAVRWYSEIEVPLVITFMAYYDISSIPEKHIEHYEFKKRTLNSYYVPKESVWREVSSLFNNNRYVYTCGKDSTTHSCSRCGNCIREFFNAKERWRQRTSCQPE